MSYLVLARKYRPSTFADIVGQEHVVRTLANAIKLGRVHHAFLFTGARGVGKTTTARVLARALNCEKGPTAEPCGACAACTEITSGASPDVLEIDGASNTGVDNVRELRENVRYLPSRGRFKLYIIDEVHMLSQAAFNALLKTLEEPPPHVKFIFATTEPHKIPVTILSRCQRFDFRRVSVPMLAEHLRGILTKEGVTLSNAALTAIVREAEGSVRDALSLLDQVLSFAGEKPDDAAVSQALGIVERQTIFDLCDALLARDAGRLLSLLADVDARGHDLADVAGLLVEHLRDLMVVKVTPDPSQALLERSPGELAALAAQADKLSRPDLHRYFGLAVSAAEDVSRSAFPRVTLEMGLLRLLEVEPTASLADVLARLDVLAGSAAGSTVKGRGPGEGGETSGAKGGAHHGSAARGGPHGVAHGQTHAGAPAEGQPVGADASASHSTSTLTAVAVATATATPSPAVARAASTPTAVSLASGAVASTFAGSSTVTPRAADATTSTPAEVPLVPVTATASHAAWGRVVDRVRRHKPAVASVLEHGKLVRFGPEAVEIAYARNTFYWEAARDPELRTLLDQALVDEFRAKVTLAINVLEDNSTLPVEASLAELNAWRRREREHAVKSEAMAHPAVRGAIDILGGEVCEVRTLAREFDDS